MILRPWLLERKMEDWMILAKISLNDKPNMNLYVKGIWQYDDQRKRGVLRTKQHMCNVVESNIDGQIIFYVDIWLRELGTTQ